MESGGSSFWGFGKSPSGYEFCFREDVLKHSSLESHFRYNMPEVRWLVTAHIMWWSEVITATVPIGLWRHYLVKSSGLPEHLWTLSSPWICGVSLHLILPVLEISEKSSLQVCVCSSCLNVGREGEHLQRKCRNLLLSWVWPLATTWRKSSIHNQLFDSVGIGNRFGDLRNKKVKKCVKEKQVKKRTARGVGHDVFFSLLFINSQEVCIIFPV